MDEKQSNLKAYLSEIDNNIKRLNSINVERYRQQVNISQQNQMCSICLQQNHNEMTILTCSHSFHRICISKYEKISKS